MNITAKLHYALVVLIELAVNQGENGIKAKDLSSNLNISLKFLDSIITSLKTSGLIYRVPVFRIGGYRLVHDPAEITVYMVYCSIEPELNIYHCLIDGKACIRSSFCGSHNFLNKMNKEMESIMLSSTLKDLVEFQREKFIENNNQ